MTEKVVELVNRFAAFERYNPGGSLADFCVNYLAESESELPEIAEFPLNSRLAALVGKMSKYAAVYSKKALSKFTLNNIEDWVYLKRLQFLKNPTKSELIYDMISEFPSGIDVIKRLLKAGLVREYQDENDKRSKRLAITDEGNEVLSNSLPWMHKVSEIAFDQLTLPEKKMLYQLLNKLEVHHTRYFMEIRNASIDEVYELMVQSVRD